MPLPPENERGAALLTVLLFVAVMAVIAATALDRLQLSTRLAVNGAAMTQAHFYGYGAEALAMSRISDLQVREPEQTTLKGDWLDKEIPFPVGQGQASARIKDASNCFNLNSLVNSANSADGGRTRFASPNAIKQFVALMRLLQVPQNEAEAAAQSAADWIDTDQLALPSGAEDIYYRSLPIPQLPPNQLMADRSELLSVKGITPAIYRRIREWICALPLARPTQINVNTLSPDQSILLAMLFDGKLSIGGAKAYLARRPLDGYSSLIRFWNAPQLATIKPPEAIQEQVQLKSKYFQLQVKIMSDGIEMESQSLIDASGPVPFVVSRSWGEAG
jgi:general secretion pathway protein K